MGGEARTLRVKSDSVMRALQDLQADGTFLEERAHDFWLMDDHRWALLAWETSARRRADRASHALLHADYHYDGVNDFQTPESVERLRTAATLAELRDLVQGEDLIRKDSFIAPAVIRGLVDRVHFVCRQSDFEPGLDQELLSRYGCRQSLSRGIDGVPDDWPSDTPTIFDLCLDLFNATGDECAEAQLWPDDDIRRFIDDASSLIRNASIVSVSLSFDYSGTAEQTRHLAKLVVPRMLHVRR